MHGYGVGREPDDMLLLGNNLSVERRVEIEQVIIMRRNVVSKNEELKWKIMLNVERTNK